MKVEKGERLPLKNDCLGCRPPTHGICYDIAYIGARPSYSFIFPNGYYDGFSPVEVNLFFNRDQSRVFHKVKDYDFQHVRKLSRDFDWGYFDVIFEEQIIDCNSFRGYTEINLGTWPDHHKVLDVYTLEDEYIGRVGLAAPKNTGWHIIEPASRDKHHRGTFLNCITKIYKATDHG